MSEQELRLSFIKEALEVESSVRQRLGEPPLPIITQMALEDRVVLFQEVDGVLRLVDDPLNPERIGEPINKALTARDLTYLLNLLARQEQERRDDRLDKKFEWMTRD